MDLRETYDRIAEDWHQDHQIDRWWIEGTDSFISRLGRGTCVLDVGCGSGIKSAYLANAGLEVFGVDFSPQMIRIAKREYPNIPFLVHDMCHVSQLELTFDAVFAQASLLHIPKTHVPAVLADWRRVLVSDGWLYVAVKGAWDGRPAEEVRVEDDYGYAYERFFSYFEPDEIAQFVCDAGFVIVEAIAQEVFPGKTGWIQVVAQCA